MFRRRMSRDLKEFCAAMDGEWLVERFELEGEKVRVFYRSLTNPDVSWSHTPFSFDDLPPVGTRGRIGFIGNNP